MRKLNAYYIISIIVLAFMLLLFIRTMQETGQLARQPDISPLEQFMGQLPAMMLVSTGANSAIQDTLYLNPGHVEEELWLDVFSSTFPEVALRLSDFEDNQVLVEPFFLAPDSTHLRMDGCECLLARENDDSWQATTLGDLCGYDETEKHFFKATFTMDEAIAWLNVESYVMNNSEAKSKNQYYLQKVSEHE